MWDFNLIELLLMLLVGSVGSFYANKNFKSAIKFQEKGRSGEKWGNSRWRDEINHSLYGFNFWFTLIIFLPFMILSVAAPILMIRHWILKVLPFFLEAMGA